MIRHPIHSAVGRGRPDIKRVTDGIAASLRHFSIAQARYSDDTPSRPTSRQRSAAAANELLSMNEPARPLSRTVGAMASKTSAAPSPAPATRAPEIPKVINVSSLRGGIQGRFTSFRKPTEDGSAFSSPTSPSASSGGIIRGGFRGRVSRGAGGGARGRGRGRGRGGGGGSDDRPTRRRHIKTAEEKEGDAEYDRFKSQEEEDPEIAAYREAAEDGTEAQYIPITSSNLLAELAGFAPNVATNSTPLAQAATALYQARMLGGGRPFHPQDWHDPTQAKAALENGEGTFFPTLEAKAWTEKVTATKFQSPPEETKTAVLESALLGKYDGPKFADPNDALSTIRSYVKRDGTWNVNAGEKIEAKVRSLLPAQTKPAGAAKPTLNKGKP